VAQAVIPTKSATSTEVLRTLVTEVINGVVQNPTANTVSAAVVDDDAVKAGTKYVPLVGDYVAQTWETDASGPQYWAAVLMGPSATLNPAGPVGTSKPKLYHLWLRIQAGTEDMRREVGMFAVTP